MSHPIGVIVTLGFAILSIFIDKIGTEIYVIHFSMIPVVQWDETDKNSVLLSALLKATAEYRLSKLLPDLIGWLARRTAIC